MRVQFRWWMAPLFGAGVLVGRSVAERASGMNLEGKKVLITGGSRGLGLVLAREFVIRGARVAICARDRGEVERARRELEGLDGTVVGFVCDVTDHEAVKELMTNVSGALGGLDILVNNAGVTQVGPLAAVTDEDFREAMAINFWAPLHATMEALPLLRQSEDARIVNISSIGGKLPVPHLLPYSASKFALTGLSEGMRAELLDEGIRVTTVCPGLMRTGSPRNATFKGVAASKEYEWFAVSAGLPLLSMSAERAAKKIVEACRRGDSEIVLSAPAKLATWFHGLFPGMTSAFLSFANQLLPDNSEGRYSFLGRATGAEGRHPNLTWLTDRAAVRNNEV